MSSILSSVLILLVCVSISYQITTDVVIGVPSTCKDLMPANYDTMKPPPDNVTATIEQDVFNIGVVKMREQTIVIKIRSVLEWDDERLSKSSCLMDNYVLERFDAKFYDCFWKPYFRTANLAGEEEVEKKQNLFILNQSGRVRLIRRYTYSINCPMDMTWYPKDVQICWISFISFKWDRTILKFTSKKLFNESLRHESAFDVKITREDNCDYHPSQSSCLKMIFTFKRRIGMYLMTIYFPSSLIVIVSFISFWIDPLSVPGRVTLTITSLLALMTQFISVREPLSDVNHVTAIDVWFMGCILMVALIMFEFCLYHFLSFRATTVNVSTVEAQSGQTTKTSLAQLTQNVVTKLQLRKINYDSISQILFPSIFFIYSSIYWIILNCYSTNIER